MGFQREPRTDAELDERDEILRQSGGRDAMNMEKKRPLAAASERYARLPER